MSEWISVEDRLPEVNRLVIVEGGVAMLCDDGLWYSYTDCHGRQIQWTVTHWMPLPEPPERQKENDDEGKYRGG